MKDMRNRNFVVKVVTRGPDDARADYVRSLPKRAELGVFTKHRDQAAQFLNHEAAQREADKHKARGRIVRCVRFYSSPRELY